MGSYQLRDDCPSKGPKENFTISEICLALLIEAADLTSLIPEDRQKPFQEISYHIRSWPKVLYNTTFADSEYSANLSNSVAKPLALRATKRDA